jgi:hypothetical protein
MLSQSEAQVAAKAKQAMWVMGYDPDQPKIDDKFLTFVRGG